MRLANSGKKVNYSLPRADVPRAVVPVVSTTSIAISSVAQLKAAGNFKRIEGNLTISGITANFDLAKFNLLTRIEGNLIIEGNTGAFTLSGKFPLLEVVTGTISIKNNTKVSTVPIKAKSAKMFPVLLSSSAIVIQNNPLLLNINGFNNVTSSDILLFNNSGLKFVEGFLQLKASNLLEIYNNINLISLPSFNELDTVSGTLEIAKNNKLVKTPTFNALITAMIILIGDNVNLNTVIGFNTLKDCKELHIYSNPQLVTIQGFNMLADFDNIHIVNNSQENYDYPINGIDIDRQTTVTITNSLRLTGFRALSTVNNSFIMYGQYISLAETYDFVDFCTDDDKIYIEANSGKTFGTLSQQGAVGIISNSSYNDSTGPSSNATTSIIIEDVSFGNAD